MPDNSGSAESAKLSLSAIKMALGELAYDQRMWGREKSQATAVELIEEATLCWREGLLSPEDFAETLRQVADWADPPPEIDIAALMGEMG